METRKWIVGYASRNTLSLRFVGPFEIQEVAEDWAANCDLPVPFVYPLIPIYDLPEVTNEDPQRS